MNEVLVWLAIAVGALAVLAVAGYFIARALFARAARRVADEMARVLAGSALTAGPRAAGRGSPGLPPDFRPGRVTRMGTYAAAEGISEEQARREFADSIERIARLMDGAITLPVIGPVGLDAVIGLFPVAGDVISTAVSLSLVARSIRYGVPRDIIARMLGNVLIDAVMGAVPVVGDVADMFFRANLRNVALLRDYLDREARSTVQASGPGPQASAASGKGPSTPRVPR